MKFNIGDKVAVSEDYEGSITVIGYSGNDIEEQTFIVVPFEEFQRKHPESAKLVKSRPSKSGEIFLRSDDEIFVLNPVSCLDRLEKAIVCPCPIARLWSGQGHYKGCPEKS